MQAIVIIVVLLVTAAVLLYIFTSNVGKQGDIIEKGNEQAEDCLEDPENCPLWADDGQESTGEG